MPAAELLIYEPIGKDFFGDGLSAADVVNFLSDIDAETDSIDVRINSPGGSLIDGTAIYNALARSGLTVRTHVDGLAASAASLIAMAGDEIHMSENALMMLHNASAFTIGTADDHEATASTLRRWSGAMATTYAKRSDLPESEVKALMDAETWLTASEAVERGLATNVVEAKSQIAASWGEKADRLLGSFANAPDKYRPPARPPIEIAACAVKGKTDMDPQKELEEIRAALGLHADAKLETVKAAIEARGNEEPQSSGDLAAMSKLADVVASLRAEVTTLRAKTEIEHFGALPKELRDTAEAAFKAGGDAAALARDVLEKAAPAFAMLSKEDDAPAKGDGEKLHGLSQEDIDFCASAGLDLKIFAEQKAKDEEARRARLEVI